MKRLHVPFLGLIAGLAFASPASAHIASAGAPHWHAGDAIGFAVVVALTGVAAWIDRRWR